jgi:hypothetical protein
MHAVEDPHDMLRIMRWPDRVAARRLGVSVLAVVFFKNGTHRLATDAVHELRRQYERWRMRRPSPSFR